MMGLYDSNLFLLVCCFYYDAGFLKAGQFRYKMTPHCSGSVYFWKVRFPVVFRKEFFPVSPTTEKSATCHSASLGSYGAEKRDVRKGKHFVRDT